MNMYKKSRFTVLAFLLLQMSSVSMQAPWYWYEPAPVVVYREPSIGESAFALGAGLGLGISAVCKRQAEKKKFRKYIQTFRDMGYSREQSQIYAQMSIDNVGGLQAVMNSINQEKEMESRLIAQQESLAAQQELMKASHGQKLEQMSHEHKLNMLTYLVMFLSTIILVGIGLLLYRRK